MDQFNKYLKGAQRGVGILLVTFCLYTAAFGMLENLLQRGVFFLLAIIAVFLAPADAKAKHPWAQKAADLTAMVVTIVATFVLLYNWRAITEGLNKLTAVEFLLGAALIICVLYATKRLIGWPVVIIAIVFLAYGRFGGMLPADFGGHRGYTAQRIVSHIYAGVNGLFGTPMGSAATLVAMFTIYAAFLEQSGGSGLFMDIAVALTGRKRGGPAKCAVVSSALFGMISGAAVTNVVTTGAFTIPLMKRTGYKAHEAGAIEAVASTGGQLMPPVMGTAAFIMADYLGIPYQKIALAALIPSLLYYIVVFMIVHLKAMKYNLSAAEEDVPKISEIMKERWHCLISILVLIYMLVVGYSTIKAALTGVITAFVCSWFRKDTRITFRGLARIFENAAGNMLAIAVVCAAAGIIIGTFSLTGMGVRLSSMVVALSGGNLLIALILSFVTVLVLGMGMPTAAAYILVSTLVAPALTEMGVAPIAAHMFVLYGAVLSAITPPVAMAAYAASGIAGANPLKIGFTAMKFAVVAFIIPFFFAYQPALLFQGNILEIVQAFATAVIGCLGLSVAVEGYAVKAIHIPVRIALSAASLLMIYPGAITDLIGLGGVAAFAALQLAGKRERHGEKQKIKTREEK